MVKDGLASIQVPVLPICTSRYVCAIVELLNANFGVFCLLKRMREVVNMKIGTNLHQRKQIGR